MACCSQFSRPLGLGFSTRSFKVFLEQMSQNLSPSRRCCVLGRVGGGPHVRVVGGAEQELLRTFTPCLSQVILNGARVTVTLPVCSERTVVSLVSDEVVRPHSISQAGPPDPIPANVLSTLELHSSSPCDFPCNSAWAQHPEKVRIPPLCPQLEKLACFPRVLPPKPVFTAHFPIMSPHKPNTTTGHDNAHQLLCGVVSSVCRQGWRSRDH